MRRTQFLRREWRRLLGLGPLVLLLALLPSLLYAGHWAEFLDHALGREDAAEDAGNVLEHARHCHFGPSACSEQPVPYRVQVVPGIVELAGPELPSIALEDSAKPLQEFVVATPTDPPRL